MRLRRFFSIASALMLVTGAGCGGASREAAPPSSPPASAGEHTPGFVPGQNGPSDGEAAGTAADDDGVSISGTMGTIDPEDADEAIRARWDEVSRCYAGSAAGKYYVAGSMTATLRIGADGAVASAVVSRSDLGCYETERCILGVLRKIRFPAPQGGPAAELTYPFQFPARAAIVTWDVSRIEKQVATQKASLAACPGAPPPALVATLYVGPGGLVQSAGLQADGTIDDAWAQCVIGRLSAWKLPDPETGVVKVQLPLD